MKKFPNALDFESLDLFCFFQSASRVHASQQYRNKGVTRNFYSLNLLAKLPALHRQTLFRLAMVEAILMRTTVEQVPSLHGLLPDT